MILNVGKESLHMITKSEMEILTQGNTKDNHVAQTNI